MATYVLLDNQNVVQRVVAWDGADTPSQFGALTPALLPDGVDPTPGDTFVPATNALTRGVPLTSQNATALRAKAVQAMATNATYLALASPTVAQNTAQVQRLTRECNALIRLVLGQLDSTAGT